MLSRSSVVVTDVYSTLRQCLYVESCSYCKVRIAHVIDNGQYVITVLGQLYQRSEALM